jgi:hypothetical protein
VLVDGWITESCILTGSVEVQKLKRCVLLLEGCCALSVPGGSGLHYSVQEPR